MKTKILLLFLLVNFLSYSQEKETVVIRKSIYTLYKGVLAETKNWYLLVDLEKNYYLANIDKPTEEVFDWFVRFKDSQNIYKANMSYSNSAGGIGGGQYQTLHFTKENEPSDILNFYVEKPYTDSIILISLADNLIFKFEIVEQ